MFNFNRNTMAKKSTFSYSSPYTSNNQATTTTNTSRLTEQKLLDAFVQFMAVQYEVEIDFEQHKFLNSLMTSNPPPQSYSYATANKVLEGIREFCDLVAKKYNYQIIGYQPLPPTSPPIKALMKTTLLGFVRTQISHLLSFYHFTHDYNDNVRQTGSKK